MGTWGVLTNRGRERSHSTNPRRSALREIAAASGITGRATLTILRMLEADEIVARQREGRRNRYEVDFDALKEHQLQAPYTLSELVEGIMEIFHRLQ